MDINKLDNIALIPPEIQLRTILLTVDSFCSIFIVEMALGSQVRKKFNFQKQNKADDVHIKTDTCLLNV